MRWENNINHDLRDVDHTGDDWKTLAEDWEVWRAYVHAENPLVSYPTLDPWLCYEIDTVKNENFKLAYVFLAFT